MGVMWATRMLVGVRCVSVVSDGCQRVMGVKQSAEVACRHSRAYSGQLYEFLEHSDALQQ